MKKILVVPTIRERCIKDFLVKWHYYDPTNIFPWDKIIVVEDNPDKTFDLKPFHSGPPLEHYSWKDIDKDLGKDSWIISRRDSAIRSYGFFKAYKEADYIFTLDDDCFPIHDNFIDDHINNLENTSMWAESIPGQRTRGLPYKNKGKAKNVVASIGLWQGVPDFDAIQSLSNQNENISLPDTYVLPIGQYVPICGMNMALKRSIIPACYFALSGEGVPYRRFDDIWFGVILKKICDHLKLMITCGKPYIHHSKASDPIVNLVKEAPGIAHHEKFWELIDNIPLSATSIPKAMKEIGLGLQKDSDEYNQKFGRAIEIWTSLF